MLLKNHSSNIRYWNYQKRVVFYSRNIANRRAEATILTFDEELLMTFKRIRFGLLEIDLADRFDIFIETVSRITTTQDILHACCFRKIHPPSHSKFSQILRHMIRVQSTKRKK